MKRKNKITKTKTATQAFFLIMLIIKYKIIFTLKMSTLFVILFRFYKKTKANIENYKTQNKHIQGTEFASCSDHI